MSIMGYLVMSAAIAFPSAAGAQGADLLAAYLQRQELGVRNNLDTHFRFDPLMDGSAIDIEISGDVVTLHGEVANERARSAAILAAESTYGVATVVDRLDVREADPPPGVLAVGGRGGPTDVNLAETPR